MHYNSNDIDITSNEPIVDNIGGQRSKFDVMAAILHICLEPSLKNHVIGKGNFSDAMANHYLTILLYHQLLESSKDEAGRMYYRTKEKGRQFIEYYKKTQDLFARTSPEVNNGSKTTAYITGASGTAAKGRGEAASPIGSIGNNNSSRTAKKKILIVDDESDISSAMKIGLEDNGFEADTYNDPTVALANYRAGTYDLLIFDVKMPHMNGFELYRKIRNIDDKVEVCFLTAFEVYSEEFKKVFPSMDVKHFIQKPIAMADLVEQIRTLTDRV